MQNPLKNPLAFKLKAEPHVLTTLYLQDINLEKLEEQLTHMLQQAPQFFKQTPIVMDLSQLESTTEAIACNLYPIVCTLRRYGMEPLIIQNTPPLSTSLLSQLGVVQRNSPTKKVASNAARALIVRKTVRSGQRIYAANKDLIVLASVSPGAELMADGHIHVYGTLRGRAMAGLSGHRSACIFCRHLHAELVAIAGIYQLHATFESRVDPSVGAHIYLDQAAQLCFAGLSN